LRHFAGHDAVGIVHSAPGAAMAIAMWSVVLVQVASGPFSSDDIFTDGPFAHYLSDSGVDIATTIHTRVYWAIIALIATHLLALAWYGLRRDAVASSMWTGRSVSGVQPIPGHLPLRAIMTAVVAAALVWAGARWL
jgi:cytochrome b